MKKSRRTKKQIIQRMNEVGVSQRVCLGSCPVATSVRADLIDKEKRVVPFVIVSADNKGTRYDWWEDEIYIEELDVAGANFDRLQTFFTDHRPSSDNAIGRIENTRVEDGEIKTEVYFGSDQRSYDIFKKYADGILTDVSIGYRVNDVTITEKKDEPTHVLVTDYEIVELSSVWRGFDAGATIGRSRDAPSLAQIPKMDGRSLEFLEKELQLGGL